jgi:hypothetical protein
MSVQIASYAPVPDGPAHEITTHQTQEICIIRIRLDADLPVNLAWLTFRLKHVFGVSDIDFENRDVIVTRKPDSPWSPMRLRICDILIHELRWHYHNTKIDGVQPNWFDHTGASVH